MDTPKPARSRLLLWLFLPVLILGPLITWLLALQVQDHSVMLRRHVLAEQHHGATVRLQAQIDHLIDAAQHLADPLPPNEARFREHAATLIAGEPGLKAVEYLETVAHGLRSDLEQQLSVELGQFIRFGRWQQEEPIQTMPDADEYLVIRWVEGSKNHGLTAGLVADTVPHWQDALRVVLTEGEVTATPLTSLPGKEGQSRTTRIFIPGSEDRLLGLAVDPAEWLAKALEPTRLPATELTVHDVDQHTKSPLLRFVALGEQEPDQALRSEVQVGNRQWLVTTTPTRAFLSEPSQRPVQLVWLAGLAITAIGVIATLVLSRALAANRRALETAEDTNGYLERRLDNNQVEKTILTQALNNSEQRSRDLVALIGGFVCELDEYQQVTYVSPQIMDILNRPPAELAERPFHACVHEADRANFEAAIASARQDRKMARIDLHLVDDRDVAVPVTLRITAVIDALSGCTGFRMTGQPRAKV